MKAKLKIFLYYQKKNFFSICGLFMHYNISQRLLYQFSHGYVPNLESIQDVSILYSSELVRPYGMRKKKSQSRQRVGGIYEK